jgi:spore maturation protein CgeB
MKILLGGRYTPKGALREYEKAFSKQGTVTYCGLPYKMERSGYAPDINLNEIVSNDDWDIFFYIEEWNQAFPVGLERLPFPTIAYFPDTCVDLKKYSVIALFFDYVFISQKWLVEKLRRVNKNTFYLPFACDPDRLKGISVEGKKYDVAFLGSLYNDRKEILTKLVKHFKMNNYTTDSNKLSLKDITRLHLESKIVFNKLPIGYGDYNLRVFDVLCCGSLLLTDEPQEHDNPLFRNKEHLITYTPKDNITDIVRYYLTNNKEREEISERGRKLVLEKHTYNHRVQTIFEIIKANNFRMEAPLRSSDNKKVFLSYGKVFSKLMMLDSMAKMFSEANVSLLCKLKSLRYILTAVLKRLRQMGWRNLFTKGEKLYE